MIRECTHIMPTGEQCRSIAMRDSYLCYFHTRQNRVQKGEKKVQRLPMAHVNDLRSIQSAIAKLMNLANSPYADSWRVDRMLQVMQLAERVARQCIALEGVSFDCPHCGKAVDDLNGHAVRSS
ncbi:MAG: hypothetical protein KGN79_03625 [Acidobacteriota bacterium]|nr:hypothetical protein [Acidobacteriota bacterium]